MTQEDEIRETVRWFDKQSDKICKELELKLGDEYRLNGNREAFRALHEEFARRMKAIGEKYGLTEEDA